jgi:hypothetical protein
MNENNFMQSEEHEFPAIVLFYGILFCFGVNEYLIYFQMLPKKNYLVVKSNKKTK